MSAFSTNKLAKIQQRALLFIHNDFASTLCALLISTNTQPLHIRRLKQMACEVFKIVNNMLPNYISDLIKIRTSVYEFGGKRKADVPRVKPTRYGLRSFRSEATRVWNSLPNEVRLVESYSQFRRLVQALDGPGCNVLFVVPKFIPCNVTFTFAFSCYFCFFMLCLSDFA